MFVESNTLFFTSLRIRDINNLDEMDLDDVSNRTAMAECWRVIAKNIDQLYVYNTKLLMDGSAWVNLKELIFIHFFFHFCSQLRLPSVTKLRAHALLSPELKEQIRRSFPNLNQIYGFEMPVSNTQIDDWTREKLKVAVLSIDTEDRLLAEKFNGLQLEQLAIKHNKPTGMHVINDIIRNQPNTDISLSLMEGWSDLQVDRIKDLRLVIDAGEELACDYLAKHNWMLRCLKVLDLYCGHNCFFGHSTLDLPHLKQLLTYTDESLCEDCWKACFESCRRVTKISYVHNTVPLKYLDKLVSLQQVKINIISLQADQANYEIYLKGMKNVKSIWFIGVTNKQSFKLVSSLLRWFPAVEQIRLFINDSTEPSYLHWLNNRAVSMLFFKLRDLTPNVRVVYIDCYETISAKNLALQVPFEHMPLLVKVYIDKEVLIRR